MPGRIRTRRALVLVGLPLAGTLLTETPAAGTPTPAAADSTTEWSVTSSAFADLWYHGLAVVGFHGFGPHPMYDMAYGRRVLREDPQAPLARIASTLGRALASDPAFEVLHFVPLYLGEASPEQALQVLHRVARAGGDPVSGRSGPGAGGVEALARVLSGEEQRTILGQLVDALRNEWDRGLRARLQASRTARRGRVRVLQERWLRTFVPALEPYLGMWGLRAGRIVVTPPLGLEGRFLQSPQAGAEPNVVVVGLGPADAGPDVTLAPVVREICYPAVRRAFEVVQWQYADRIAASRASDAAATRCGELLLERHLPAVLPAYRNRFGLQGPHASSWSSLPDPAEGRAWDAALERVLNLSGGS